MEKEVNKKSGFAVAGFVLGIIGICLSFIPILNNAAFFLGALAIIFAIVSLVKRASKAMSIVALILGVLAIIVTLALQSSWSKALDDVSEELDNATGGNTEEVLKNVDVNIGTFEVTTDEYGLNETKLVVKVTNKLDERKSYNFEIEAVATDGSKISTDYITATNLDAGQSQDFEIFTFVDDAEIPELQKATFNVIEASMY